MSVHPFGSPDAATADLDLEQQYQSFENIDGSLTGDWGAAIPRVVFGRKGSGKSHYLRALNAIKSGDHSVLAFGPSTDPPQHDWVIKLSLALEHSAIPGWNNLWQKSILASAAVTLLYNDRRNDSSINELFLEQLEIATKLVLGVRELPNGPLTPFGAARHLLSHSGSLDRFYAILGRPQWQVLEDNLEPVLAGSPPLYFFLDNLDSVELFAPRPWRACQRGLLDAVLSLAEDSRWKRIHVIVALKDTVVQTLFDSVHGQKYIHSSMLHRLEWSTEQSLEFLRRKIDSLPAEWFTGPEVGSPAVRWLGRASITNEVRRCDEDIEAYLLRHTLLLPRDIVEMGNCLCDAITKARARGRETLTDDEVRTAVNRAAEQIGKTGVYCAAIEVARRLMPSDAPLDGSGESYGLTGAPPDHDPDDDMTYAISEQYAQLLTKVLAGVGRDRFGDESVRGIERSVRELLSQSTAPREALGALWRLGMVGVVEGDLESGEAVFYGHSEHDGASLPTTSHGFAFHPSMIDYLGPENVAAIGKPVYPEPGFLSALGV